MCLFPRLIRNRRYTPNKKNNYTQLQPEDERELYVPIGCGNCIECRQQIANAWRIRLCEEIKIHKYTYFVTLTIDDEHFAKIIDEIQCEANNAIAKIMIRRFLERWRKRYKTSVKHWFITELGEKNDRLHLHGFIFSDNECKKDIAELWQYGNVYIGEYCNVKTINYCVKYALKIDEKHKDYKFIILCSKGIGANYIDKNILRHTFNNTDTIETYRLNNGNEVNLPIYYRNKLFTENERTKLWMQKLDTHTRYIRGIKINISTNKGIETYEKILAHQQKINKQLGYGDFSKEWRSKDYNTTLQRLNAKRTYQNAQKIK